LTEVWPNKEEHMSYEVLEKLPYLVRSPLFYLNIAVAEPYT
jgi:hypothetical protein